ncbi:MAG TPA: GNAT family N-acetyltransferase, partial [Candidatus Polarisedimenticolaceae bacterium]|nr:GNAT family N-acetyltransferase [Candidatus Polarisedimenticolaceae bacterium]
EIAGLAPAGLLLREGDLEVYVVEGRQIPELLTEIGRLREISFREVGEGTGRAIDLDEFDASYLQLFVWSPADREVVGAYRIGRADRLVAERGPTALYTSTLFDFAPELLPTMGPALELGRSFVRPERQRSYAPLLLLWRGIAEQVLREPRYATLFGPVSISADYSAASQRVILDFLRENRLVHDWSRWVRARNPLVPSSTRTATPRLADLRAVSHLVAQSEADRKGVPVLLRHYLQLGGSLLGCNVDPAFSNVLDLLVVVDLRRTPLRTLARYMGRERGARFLEEHAVRSAHAG